MRSKAILILAVALGAMTLVGTANGVTLTWAPHPSAPARDFAGNPLPGTPTFGAPNLANGALMQLWLAVGTIDNPFMVPLAYEATDWHVDDVLLQESNIGHAVFTTNSGTWSTRTLFPTLKEGDIVYVRAYNLPKTDWTAAGLTTRELGIANSQGEIVSNALTAQDPQVAYFDDLKTRPIPEPATLLLLAPGLALWAIRRKK